MPDSPFKSWESQLLRACSQCSTCRALFDRVTVLESVTSTQDVAHAGANGKPGLIVTSLRQTAGRGRLGRSWEDTSDKGLAITFVVDAEKFAAPVLSLAAGLAAAWTVGDIADPNAAGLIGLKWPNDVVERTGARRKIGGVLIERFDNLAFIGIGINVHQLSPDFSPELQSRAASLAMLGAPTDRLEVATRLVSRLNIALLLPVKQIVARWKLLDTLTDTEQTFEHDGQRFTGRVTSIEPLESISLKLGSGDQIELPVLTTSLVKDAS